MTTTEELKEKISFESGMISFHEDQVEAIDENGEEFDQDIFFYSAVIHCKEISYIDFENNPQTAKLFVRFDFQSPENKSDKLFSELAWRKIALKEHTEWGEDDNSVYICYAHNPYWPFRIEFSSVDDKNIFGRVIVRFYFEMEGSGFNNFDLEIPFTLEIKNK